MSRGRWVTSTLTLSDTTLSTEQVATVDLTDQNDWNKVRISVTAAFPATPSTNVDVYLRPSVTGDTPWAANATLTAVSITGGTDETSVLVLDAFEAPGAQLYIENTDDANSVDVTAHVAKWVEY